MIKKHIQLVLILLISTNLFSQENKRNNNWVIGLQPTITFDFNSSQLNINNLFTQLLITRENSCISNINGELLFFSTGFNIFRNNGQYMNNGQYVNCPKGNVFADYSGGSSLSDQTSIILPKKGNSYYVFSTGMGDSLANNWINNGGFAVCDILNYSVVDMDSNGGNGKVIDKNHILLDHQEYANTALTAVRHGNGKDWWLVKADCSHHQYQKFWVQADTILGPYYQTITDTANFCAPLYSQIYFSDDGTKFASSIYRQVYTGTLFSEYNRVDIYDFNRCTGELTFNNYYKIPVDTVNYSHEDGEIGICFSPNGKLLYMSTFFNIFQIDLNDTNKNNGIWIHGPDTTISEFPSYDLMSCAPNGKLYIGNFDATQHYMSYIDSPNVRGLGCHFVPHGVWQPYTNLYNPPNMPNYGLVSVDTAHGCYPLGIPNPPMEDLNALEVYPNPSSTKIFIKYVTAPVPTNSVKHEAVLKELYNSIGQMMLSTKENEIDVSKLSKGLYYLKVENETKKVIIE